MTSAMDRRRGSQKSRQEEQNQLICDSNRGVKKSEKFADVIYGSPLKRDDLVSQRSRRRHGDMGACIRSLTHNTQTRREAAALAMAMSSSPVPFLSRRRRRLRHLSLRTISSKKHQAKRLTRQVKNSLRPPFLPLSFYGGGSFSSLPLLPTDRPSDRATDQREYPCHPLRRRRRRLQATHSTRVRRQRKHFLVQVLTAAATAAAGMGEGNKREEAHSGFLSREDLQHTDNHRAAGSPVGQVSPRLVGETQVLQLV